MGADAVAVAETTYTRVWVRCRVCRHAWYPRNDDDLPARCPSPTCRSTEWREGGIVSGVGQPRGGPKPCRCLRCGYEWFPRKVEERPERCGSCMSPYWHKPRMVKRKQQARRRDEPRKR